MRIREAGVGDAGALTRVARLAKASWGYPEAWLAEWEPILTISPEYVRGHRVLVAEEGGSSLGFAALVEGPSGAQVDHLWVLPEHHGAGVGRALLERVLAEAAERGWDSVRVESDPHARPFYERLGGVWIEDVPAPVAGTDRRLPVLRLPARRASDPAAP